MADKVVDEDI